MAERDRNGLGLKVENGCEKELERSRPYHEVEFPGGGGAVKGGGSRKQVAVVQTIHLERQG